MTAQIGYDGLDHRGDPRAELLIDVARAQPEPGGDWVHLGRLGVFGRTAKKISALVANKDRPSGDTSARKRTA